jgi:tetratricopeptide (TPR) repeat protein
VSIRQRTSVGNSGNRISSNKTSRIVSRIETNRPTKSNRQNKPAGKPSSRIDSGKISRIVSRIETNRPRKSTSWDKLTGRLSNRKGSDNTSRSANRKDIEKRPKVSVKEKTVTGDRQNRDDKRISDKSSNRANRKADSVNKGSKTEALSPRRHKGKGSRIKERLLPGPRLRKSVQEKHTTIVDENHRRGRIGSRGHGRKGSSHHRFHDRPDSVRHVHRYEHVFRDWRNRFCHRIVWPKYRFIVRYDYGPWFAFRYVYPYYHRKYIFVSLGGYWPIEYRYRRYYWYGCHPYRWSGYYPIAREVKSDTYNYYTYNYYYDNDDPVTYGSSQATDMGYISPVDHNTFADVREKLAKQAAEEPALPGLADVCFEDAVKAFEVDDYDVAIERFAKAMELAPEDVVLPFAYSQALLADKRYPEAAEALRIALLNVPHDKEGVFYPRGLYSDDNMLFEQIDDLTEEAELYRYDADLQLLLGYQLLGVGEIDEAFGPLQQASIDLENAVAANMLLDLLEKIKVESNETENINQ